jgi:hypothetical protein
MASEDQKPFKLSPGPITAILMVATAFGFDALQFFLGSVLTVVVGAGLAVAFMITLLSTVIFLLWFKFADNNNENHFVGRRVLKSIMKRIFVSALTFGSEFIPGLDLIVPGITAGVVANIAISWTGDMKANKLAQQEAGGKDMSDRNARRLDRRWTGVDPDTRSRQEASLQQRARDDAGDGKKRDEVVRRQKLAKEEHAALDVVGLVAPEARFAAEAVKTGQKSFDALRAHQDRKRKGAAKPPEAAKDNRPYASDQSKAV